MYYRIDGLINLRNEYTENSDDIKSKEQRPTTSRTAGSTLRRFILERDNYTCQICKVNTIENPNIKLEIDHIKPYSRGGETKEYNLQVLCRKCNRQKNNKI